MFKKEDEFKARRRLLDNLTRAKEIVGTWPAWKRNFKLTKYSG